VAAISDDRVFVWNVKTGELSSSFSLDLMQHFVNGALLASCYLFVITSQLEVHVWNIVNGTRVLKWSINQDLMNSAGVFLSPAYTLQILTPSPSYSSLTPIFSSTSTLVIAAKDTLRADPYYFEFRVSPPRFMGFRKRKREQLRN